MSFAGFNNSRKRSTISNGDWDRDGVKNKKDCEPLNFRKQGPEHEGKPDPFFNEQDTPEYAVAVEEKYWANMAKKHHKARWDTMSPEELQDELAWREQRQKARREINTSPNFKDFRAALRKIR